jgi:carbon monoxide dehydrogenase subunit G
MHRHVESHEYLGELVTYAVDLHALYDEVTSARYVLLSPEEAHGTLTYDLPVPQPLAWEWLNDPLRRNELMPGVVWSASDRPSGRTRTGASNYCAHGKNGLVCETILDWRPFEYVTSLSTSGKLPDSLMDMTQTVLLQPVDGGEKTRVEWRVRMERLPGWLARWLLAPKYLQAMRKQYVEPLDQMIQQAVAVRQETAVDRAAVAPSGNI